MPIERIWLQEHDRREREKTIDEFAKSLNERLEEESDFFNGVPMGCLQKHFYCEGVEKSIEIVNQLAEQLKEGGKHD